MPKISIIVPIYNTEKYLQRCIDSILNQTFKDFELILVNDGSTDLSGKIIEDYARKDKRIKTLHIENSGQGAARNRGLDIATGDYIGFVDSDDWIHQDMYQVLYRECRNQNTQICQINHMNAKDFILDSPISRDYPREVILDIMKKFADCTSFELLPYIYVWNKLYKREIWENIRFPENKFAEDLRVIYKIYDQIDSLIIIDLPLYYYFLSPLSSTRGKFNVKKLEDLEAWIELLEFYQKSYPDIDLTNLKMIYCGRNLRYYFWMDEDSKLYRKERKYVLSSFRKNLTQAIRTKKLNIKEKSVYLCFFICPRLCRGLFKRKLNLK